MIKNQKNFLFIVTLVTAAIWALLNRRRKDNSGRNESIRILLRQAARWAVAAQQDDGPLIAILHANYAAGYLWALLDISTPDEIEHATGIDFHGFKGSIQRIQDNATEQLARKCSLFISNDLLTRAARGSA